MNITNNIVIYYSFIFFLIIFLFQKFKLYKHEKYKVYISLFVASNVIFTIYIIFIQAQNHSEEIINSNSTFYNDLMNNLYDETLKIFRENPKMKYYFDELFNNIDSSSTSEYLIQRDPYLEEIISYRIMSSMANYTVFYYSHVNLDNYKDLIVAQRYRIIKIINMFLNSKIFREYLDKYLNNFSGMNNLKFFKEFFNIVPSNPNDDFEKLLIKSKIKDGKIIN